VGGIVEGVFEGFLRASTDISAGIEGAIKNNSN